MERKMNCNDLNLHDMSVSYVPGMMDTAAAVEAAARNMASLLTVILDKHFLAYGLS
jgi:hypothetical protein